MATLTPLQPNSTGTVNGVTDQAGSAANLHTVVSDGQDSTYLHPGVDLPGDLLLGLSNVDADFASMDTVAFSCSVRLNGTVSDDSTTLTVQVFDGNATTTALTSVASVATQANAGGTFNVKTGPLTIQGTPTKAQWDNAFVRLVWTYTKNKASDGIEIQVSEVSITGTYTAGAVNNPPNTPVITNPADSATVNGTVSLEATVSDPESDNVYARWELWPANVDDFEADTIGAVPSGWTVSEGNGFEVSTGKHLSHLATRTASVQHLINWTEIGTSADVIIEASCSSNDASSGSFVDGPAVHVRQSGSGATLAAYRWELAINSGVKRAQLGRFVSGAWSVLDFVAFSWSASTDYQLKLEVLGTTVRGKVWATGSAEPGSWNVSVTNGEVTGAGNVGVGTFGNQGTHTYDDILLNGSPVSITENTTPVTSGSTHITSWDSSAVSDGDYVLRAWAVDTVPQQSVNYDEHAITVTQAVTEDFSGSSTVNIDITAEGQGSLTSESRLGSSTVTIEVNAEGQGAKLPPTPSGVTVAVIDTTTLQYDNYEVAVS